MIILKMKIQIPGFFSYFTLTRKRDKGIKLLIILLFLGSTSISVIAQAIETIDLKEVPQKKVRKYIESRSIDQMQDFSLIKSSWKKGTNESDFNLREKIFYLKFKLATVWECYRHADPVKTWNGKSIKFALMISKSLNSVTYKNCKFSTEADTGQVYFLDLKVMKGLFNIPVAFEITGIDQDKQIFEFSYIENNKSLGKQTIQFFDNGDGRTRIIHRSYFKSGSNVRDALLYPWFHKKFIKEFHRNMRQFVKHSDSDFTGEII